MLQLLTERQKRLKSLLRTYQRMIDGLLANRWPVIRRERASANLIRFRHSYASDSRTLTRVARSAGHRLANADSTTTMASQSANPLIG